MTRMTLNDKFGHELDLQNKRLKAGKLFARSARVQTLFRSIDYLCEKYNCYSSMWMNGSNIYVTMNLRDLNGLKDENLAALLNSMIHHEPDHTTNSDYAVSLSREYRFQWDSQDDEHPASFMVLVAANFKEDSETCRRVVVGYRPAETEPSPIYELRCDGDGTELTQQSEEA